MQYLDKLGWPVERIKGRRVLNFLRLLIHTRKIKRGKFKHEIAQDSSCTESPLITLLIVGLFISGCTAGVGNDKTGEYCFVAFLQGTAMGHMDPNSGGTWRRTGPTDMSGVEIVRDDEGYSVCFDSAKSKTEWDAMSKMFEMGIKVGKAVMIP